MERLGIISVDGHVTGSRAQYREYVDRKHLDAYDEWVGPSRRCRSSSAT